jgi:hypothetical protein
MPTYKNTSTKDIYVKYTGIKFRAGEEVEMSEFLPPNDDIVLIRDEPYPHTPIILSKIIDVSDNIIEIPCVASSYNVSIIGQGGVLAISTGDTTKFWGCSESTPFLHTFTWSAAPKLRLISKVGIFKGIITITY